MEDRLERLVASFQNEKDRQFIQEALQLQQEAEGEGIRLRLLGSLAFRLQCPENAHHFEALERRITDIDFAVSTVDRERILAFFGARGYHVDENVLYTGGGYRYIFENPRNQNKIDVFFDRLEMCHTVAFKDRLDLDKWTLSLTDLLLEKMQIVDMSGKDYKDTAILFLEHGVGKNDGGIDLGYITDIMSGDWGFFYTFTSNMRKLKDHVSQFDSFSEGEKQTIHDRIERILESVRNSEKSLRWKARARIGTRLRWYRQVD